MRLRPGLRPGLCWWGAYSAPLDPLTNGRKGAAPLTPGSTLRITILNLLTYAENCDRLVYKLYICSKSTSYSLYVCKHYTDDILQLYAFSHKTLHN